MNEEYSERWVAGVCMLKQDEENGNVAALELLVANCITWQRNLLESGCTGGCAARILRMPPLRILRQLTRLGSLKDSAVLVPTRGVS
jgi:hypothetical protein